ncbi:MAG: hypothetical protein IT318_08350 [Anaerolineales bacterium]|nr:hypothetical protein [Anaerolineales bacterium]
MVKLAEAVLAEFGWKYEIISEDHIVTGFKSTSIGRSFTINVYWESDWISFVTSPLPEPLPPHLIPKFSIYIAKANFYMPVAKYSISDDNDIRLSVEFPTSHLTEACLGSGLELLCSIAEEQTPELAQLIDGDPA